MNPLRLLRLARLRPIQIGLALLLAAASLPLTACKNFFVCDKASCTDNDSGGSGSGSGSTTNDYAYVAFSTTTNNNTTSTINTYNVGSGTLTAVGSGLSLNYVPVAMTVAPSDAFLYVVSLPSTPSGVNPGIYGYTIGSTGALTAMNNGSPLITGVYATLAISPDGGWLYAINDIGAGTTGASLEEFSVNTSTGGLTDQGPLVLAAPTCTLSVNTPVLQPCGVSVSPSGNYVVVAQGSTGTLLYPFSSSSGITSGATPVQLPVANLNNDWDAVMDKSDNVYIARTSALTAFNVSSSTITQEGNQTGIAPRAVALSTSNDFVYTANPGASTISAFAVSNGALNNTITNQPFAAPAGVSSIGLDQSGQYLVAVGYDSTAGVAMYTIGTGGALTSVATQGTSTTTTFPAVVAMTH